MHKIHNTSSSSYQSIFLNLYHIRKVPKIRLFKINNFQTQKIERLFITSIIKFVIMIFFTLSGYCEHYPNVVNYPTF